MEEELISVIVPIYNIKAYLPRCLDCIGNQTYRNLEIILVDDGSTDGSSDICDEFAARDSRTKVIHQPNKGLWAARNAGQESAHGVYLFFPDGDDYFHFDFLRIMYEAVNLDGHKYGLAICGMKRTMTSEEMVTTEVKPLFRALSQEDLMAGLFSRGDVTFCTQWNKLYRAEVISDLFSRDFVRSQDRDFQTRLFLRLKDAVFVDNALYYWSHRSGSLTMEAGAAALSYACRVEMDFLNYKTLPNDSRFRHYLLHDMYKHMVLWKHSVQGSENSLPVVAKCKAYERETIQAYLSCRRESFVNKMCVLVLLHSAFMTKIWASLTNN